MSTGTFHRLASAACLGVVLLLLGMAKPLAAQSVVGVSEILSSTDSSEIDTYSATEIDYQTSLYYGAYVEGYLYQNGSLIASGSASDPSDAYGYMSKPLQVPDQYQLESDHYLVAEYVYEDYDGTTYWSNPDDYLIASGDSSYPSGSSFAAGGGPAYYDTQYFYLGSTAVQMSSAGPTITSISPTSANVGTSGTITVYGSNLVDVFTSQASAAVTGSGVSLSVSSANASQVVLNFSIATNASTGNQNVTLSTRFGTSNAAVFRVDDPTPVVSSITPSTWSAGAVTQITVNGHSFGTSPSPTVSGPGVSGSAVVSASDTQIVANVTVAASSPGGTATVQVQSSGYTGNGFAGNPGQSAQGSNTASIQPIPAPVPQILFQGTNVALTTQTVLMGQLIALTVPLTGLPAGLTVQSQVWSGISGTSAVGGYSASTSSGQTVPLPMMAGSGVSFYWITPGNQAVRYTWILSNGQTNSATVTFTVSGPSNAVLNSTLGTVSVWPAGVGAGGHATTPFLEFGNANTQNGINFQASADSGSADNGSWQFVQLITRYTIKKLTSTGVQSTDFTTGLDNTYPYPMPPGTTSGTNDSPGFGLAAGTGESAAYFTAAMYLMWIPNASGGCTSSIALPCTIPVPLGSVTWGYSGMPLTR